MTSPRYRERTGLEVVVGRLLLVQHELHRVIVDLPDVLDQRRHAHALIVLVRTARNLMIGVIRVVLALEAVKHIIGVEIARRREVLGGVEFDAPAQEEGMEQPILRCLP